MLDGGGGRGNLCCFTGGALLRGCSVKVVVKALC